MTMTIRMDTYSTEFLERVYYLLVNVEDADRVLLPDAVVRAADELRTFLDDHGRRLFG